MIIENEKLNSTLNSKLGDSNYKGFSHINPDGIPTMVDITNKEISKREAKASGFITLSNNTIEKIKSNSITKGNVISTAKIAGIMAAKKTSDLIPLCHQIELTAFDLIFEFEDKKISVISTAFCIGRTGAEMEALVGVSVALLTVYDMCKAVDKSMVIGEVRLCQKSKQSV